MMPNPKDIETLDPNLMLVVTGLYAFYNVVALWNYTCTC